jgi:DNA-binding MarR family transcriptional regulator
MTFPLSNGKSLVHNRLRTDDRERNAGMATRKRVRRTTPEGEALFDVVIETLAAAFRLRAAGREAGAVTAAGGGLWGLLHSLSTGGPQTVPQLARARPVARQHIQKLADELAADGLVEFVDNPAHRRSKLLRLTAKGATVHDELTERIRALTEELARGLDADELRTTARMLRTLRERLAER